MNHHLYLSTKTMALISMAVYDTAENHRTKLTSQTLQCLFDTVDFTKHRLIISDNGSCSETQELYQQLSKRRFKGTAPMVIYNNQNLGTAEAINKAWYYRKPGEHAIKIDNDVLIHSTSWADELEEAIARDPQIGIIGLKRKDIIQCTAHPDANFRSQLIQLPHKTGERWIIVERTADIIGTCTLFNSALLDKVGYSYQPGLYGYEDVLFCHRSHLAGFYNCFLPHIHIDHIDPGNTPYQHWKEKHSGKHTAAMIAVFKQYLSNPKAIYYDPFGNS